MSTLLVWREKLQRIYALYSIYIQKGLQFVTGLVLFWVINSNIGFMKPASSVFCTLGLAVICTFLPMTITVLAATALILAHFYALSLPIALVALVIFILMYIFYFRFTPKKAWLVLISGLAFSLKIPFVIPIAFGLLGSPVWIVPASCGIITYYMTDYVKVSAAALKEGLSRCRNTMLQNWNDLIAQKLATAANRRAAMDLVTITNDVSALRDCDIVFEAVSEDVNIKQRVYSIITEVCGRDIIVVSTTSSIDAAILAEKIENPARFLIAHPFQPVHMLPLVEVVRHTETSEETLNQVCTLLKDLNRQVVMLNRSVPGFLVNRFAQALFRESIYLIEQGITTAADIDRAIKYAVGMRYASIGLLEYYDAVGFELERAIALNVYPDLCDTKSIQKTTLVGIASGRTGQKAGQGLYDWSEKDEDDFRYRKQAPYFEGVRQWHMPE